MAKSLNQDEKPDAVSCCVNVVATRHPDATQRDSAWKSQEGETRARAAPGQSRTWYKGWRNQGSPAESWVKLKYGHKNCERVERTKGNRLYSCANANVCSPSYFLMTPFLMKHLCKFSNITIKRLRRRCFLCSCGQIYPCSLRRSVS